ncbi:methyl-accepting chemotaxis protein [Pseudoalteromonas tunicata]|uniref:methyl-accepting chemotaxis protein n=1 Tax=Pseudoalteromonas tunicata TaxID=314281 RepID=UPI00273ECC31|nr:methyl-accepting chemotaxis protein [Pseudoalteromonas tunicata]MDP5212353.1 methyl-accepting chemotaxis protein [Pseudoalteromonas tunicata]
MKIRTKLILMMIALAIIPLISLSILLGKTTINSVLNTAITESENSLVASREQKKQQIEGYFHGLESQAISLANNLMVVDAATHFKQGFFEPANLNSSELFRNVSQFYQNQFDGEYARRNGNKKIDSAILYQSADPITLYWQNQYIVQNSNKLGEKQLLNKAVDGSSYSQWHQLYHPIFRDYVKQFGFYDLFIIDASTSKVLYSVYKEADYATQLKSGEMQKTGLAKAYSNAINLSKDQTYLSDFSPYLPSYFDGAAFISTPIYQGDHLVAVLALQMPIGKINTVMTNNKNWLNVGMGKSGETYLVGPDKLLRTESRFLIENKAGLIDVLSQSAPQVAEKIANKHTAIGILPVTSPGVGLGLAGKSGFQEYIDYRGEPVFSAYAPVKVGDMTWVLMSEIDKAEALASANTLLENIVLISFVVTLFIGLIALVVSWLFSQSITKPLQHLINNLKDIATGGADLTRQLEEANRKDEIGELGKAFNLFNLFIKELVIDIKNTSEHLAASSSQLSGSTEIAMDAAAKQKTQTEMVAAAVEQFHASIREVAMNTEQSSDSSENADSISKQSAEFAEQARQQIDKLVTGVKQASVAISDLNNEVDEINSILVVIDEIAEQTNLLALNAAIEAARAGEHGRGFSVVADEVRSLAARTQVSTVEIQNRINALKTAATTAVSSMDHAASMAESGIDLVSQVRNRLVDVSNVIASLSLMNASIAQAANQQKFAADSVSESICSIDEYAQSNAALSIQVKTSSQELNCQATSLSNLVGRFKTS